MSSTGEVPAATLDVELEEVAEARQAERAQRALDVHHALRERPRDGGVLREPVARPPVAHANAYVAAHVVLGVAGQENSVRAGPSHNHPIWLRGMETTITKVASPSRITSVNLLLRRNTDSSTWGVNPVTIRTERVGIVGAGRLGSALARGFHAASVPLWRSPVARPSAPKAWPSEVGARAVAASRIADDAAADLPGGSRCRDCGRRAWIARSASLSAAHALVHTSGSRDLRVLEAYVEDTRASVANAHANAQVSSQVNTGRAAQLGCFHPLQSFPIRSGARTFRGVTIGIEAPSELFAQLGSARAAAGRGAHVARGRRSRALSRGRRVREQLRRRAACAGGAGWQAAGCPKSLHARPCHR